MKKSIIVAVIFLTATAAQAQKAIKFNMRYMPNHVYKTVLNTVIDMDAAQNAAAKQKSATPMLMQNEAIVGLDIKTGAADKAGSFPVVFEMKNFTTKGTFNGKAMPSPANPMIGMKITGIYTAGQLHVDTVTGGDQKAVFRKSMVGMINKMQHQIKFPDKPLTVGQTFTQDIPISLPFGGTQMNMATKTQYKLLKIAGNLAYFDLVQSMDINKGDKNAKMSGSAEGTGTMTYDISQNYPVATTSNFDMKYTTDFTGNAVNVKMKMKVDAKNVISAK